MTSIVLLGTGNVATHLFHAFKEAKDVVIAQVYGRKKESLSCFEPSVKVTDDIAMLVAADIYILAISDGSIGKVSQSLFSKKGLVVHTSGSIPLNSLATERRGVFYPLQTLTKDKNVDFSEVPICVEAENTCDLQTLKVLGSSISKQVHHVSTEQRKKIHLSAVLVNNFTNHLFYMANEICEENNIPFHMLHPLISETVDKIRHLSPLEAQTGPARRNDVATMQLHLEQLELPLQKKVYQFLSESIKTTYEKEL